MDAQSEAEFSAFVYARWPALTRTAYLLTGDHGKAEDLVQQALAQTYRHWRRIRRRDAPEVYVRKVMVNLHSYGHRRRRVTEHLVADLPEQAGQDPGVGFDEREAMWQMLGLLPPRMRAVLVLRFFEDLPEAEVARILGCSVGSVKSQTSRGLDRLRAVLGVAGRTG